MAMVESEHRATSDPESRKRVLKEMKDNKVEYVLFWFTDLEGHLKSFAITPARDRGGARRRDGLRRLVITGFNAIEESDMVAIPDPETFRLMPSREGEAVVGRVSATSCAPDGEPYEGDRATRCGARSSG